MKFSRTWAAAAAIVAMSGHAQAALIDNGGGLIYDSTQKIYWLADMNYAKTSGYDADGKMTWAAAKLWAENLVYGGYSDWRLPTLNTSDTSCSSNFNPGGGFGQHYYGYDCNGGELSHLFVTDLGNGRASVQNQTGDTAEQIRNLALFSNVGTDEAYWSGTAYEPNLSFSMQFEPGNGYQYRQDVNAVLYAVAVRGDVPEPQTLALVLLALGATVVARTRRPG